MNLAELEKKAEGALIYLHKNAEEHAALRAQADHLADYLKVVLAEEKGRFVGASQAVATDEAMRSENYKSTLDALKTARELWYTAQFKRAAAETHIEAWRTCCSNARANV